MAQIDPALLIADSPDAVVFADTEGRIVVWNAAAERIFGYTEAEALGQTLDIIVPERFRDAHWKGFDRALGEKATKYAGQTLPTRAQRKDGSQIYVELSFAIVVMDGEAVGALATARDITERFERERDQRAKLRAAEEELAKLKT
jgi:PAS domain S-box-containing protein